MINEEGVSSNVQYTYKQTSSFDVAGDVGKALAKY